MIFSLAHPTNIEPREESTMPNHTRVSLPLWAFRIAAALAVVLLTGETAQAGSDMVMPGMHHGQAATKTFAFGQPGKPDEADRTVTIVMTDNRFDPDKLEVKVGETIRFVLTNTSTLDHDFTLGDVAIQKAHRAEMAEMAKEGHEMHHAGDPDAVFVTAGQSGELTWRFTRAGRLEFDCNVPRHYEAGMAGTISVVRK